MNENYYAVWINVTGNIVNKRNIKINSITVLGSEHDAHIHNNTVQTTLRSANILISLKDCTL